MMQNLRLCELSEVDILEAISKDPLSRHFVTNEREILALVNNICHGSYNELDWDDTFETLEILKEALEENFPRETLKVAFRLAYQIIVSAFYPALFFFDRWVRILETEYIPIEKLLGEVSDLIFILERIKELN